MVSIFTHTHTHTPRKIRDTPHSDDVIYVFFFFFGGHTHTVHILCTKVKFFILQKKKFYLFDTPLSMKIDVMD